MSGTRAPNVESDAPDGPVLGDDYASSREALEQSALNYPDFLVFDIDPYIYSGKEKQGEEPELNEKGFATGKKVAFWLRALLTEMGLRAIVKTTGKTGLHVFVPIERTVTFDTVRQLCEMVGRHVLKDHPKEVTMEWAVEKRPGKIFIDYNMNVRGKTLAAAYSPRGSPGAPVSMPLTWDELERAHPEDFTVASVIGRLEKTGDRWHDWRSTKQNLARILGSSTIEGLGEANMAAARSIGSVTISFGLVAIPVKLYSATQSSSAISFNLLHKGCGSRLRQQYVCLKHGTVVERDDMVKGYEFAKDQYVTFEPQEIKALEEAGTHAIDITEFVPIESVDPVYFDKTYYLAPDKGGAKPYALLTEALKQANRCAIGHWAARGKAYLVMLRPVGDG